MPQLDSSSFLTQIFWLLITFSFLLIFLCNISLPRIKSVLEKRENKINEEIKTAKKLQAEAQEIQFKIDKQLNEAKEEVSKSINESSKNFEIQVALKIKKIEEELKKETDAAAISIEKNKKDIFKNINIQIRDITKLTLSKILQINVIDKDIDEAIKKK